MGHATGNHGYLQLEVLFSCCKSYHQIEDACWLSKSPLGYVKALQYKLHQTQITLISQDISSAMLHK